MVTTGSSDKGVDARSATALGTTAGDVSYAAPRAARRRGRLVAPAIAVGLGLVLGTGGLAVLQLL